MDALEAIKKRRSVRRFADKPVPRPTLEAIVDAGRWAATARNEQPWEFVVVTQRDTLKALGEATDHGRFIAEAAACVAVVCKPSKYYLEDGSAATQNILVAATAMGVDSCWVAGDKKPYCEAVLRILGAPVDAKLAALVALGYRAGEVKTPPKRALAEVIHWERW
jgi:nitroreductase